MRKNKKRSQGSRRPIPERGNKNMRRDAEMADTAAKEYSADARQRRDCYKSQDNDWQWYAQSPQLVRDYASFPFGKAVGMRNRLLPSGYPGADSAELNSSSIPGVMAYYFQPAVGNPQDANAPINIAARNIYSYVRHANSGHANYEAPDLMLYLLAMDSVYMYHSFLRRVLGMVYAWNALNRYYPEAILKAMWIDADDIMKHIADLRGYINMYAIKMGSMCVPNSMSYMARHVWMCEGLYTDASSTKAQTYFYTPSAYYQFSYDTSGAAPIGQISLAEFCRPFYGTGTSGFPVKKFSDLVQFGDSLLDPILSSEDMNIMSGDILKAFGDAGVIKAMGVADGFMVLPSYSQEVLSQMENATVFNGFMASTLNQKTEVGTGYLYQNNSGVINLYMSSGSTATTPTVTATQTYVTQLLTALCANKLLNFHHDAVTPEEVMVATRLSNVCKLPTAGQTIINSSDGYNTISVTCDTIASEMITACLIYGYEWWANGTMNLRAYPVPTLFPISQISATGDLSGNKYPWNLLSDFITLSKLSCFDWHHAVYPTTMYRNYAGNMELVPAAGVSVGHPMQDIDNYTIIDEDNLRNMAQAALLSEFSVPQMGAFNQKL